MSDIFLSYRRSDQTLARALVEALQARGVDVWWDQKIEGGEDWRDAIVEGLTSAHTVVILFSEECNASKQLKKELAIADTLDKEVVPVLIEDTQPKGHYLYELAARNWLQAHPEPMSRIDQLADRLAREMADNRPVPAVAGEPVVADPAPVAAGSRPAAQLPADAPAPNAPLPASKPAPPVKARTVETVVEKARAGEKAHKQRRDFLPFKWYEILIAVAVSLLVLVPDEAGNPPANPGWDLAMGFFLILAVIALLVFPIRYYVRRRRVWHAVRFFFFSTLTVGALFGLVVGLHPELADETMGGMENLLAGLVGGIVVIAFFSLIAFGIYGILHFQRTLRSFRNNVEAV